MEGVGNSPPPFLSKTYDMVDDPSTDTVVSWSKSNNSFVVWNVPDFSRDVLPKFFKHNNFSSFVRQLNTYGFRKVDPDRFEFANEGFLKGQKHLLKNITRRKGTHAQSLPQISQVQSTSVGSCVEVGKFGLDEDVEMLKRDKNVLMQELVRLRQQQQTTDSQLQTVGQRVHVMEQRQQQMMSFLAKAMQSPGFVAQLVNEPNDGNRRISGLNKKRRLQNPGEETLVGNPGLPSSPNGQVVKYEPLMNEAAKAVLHQILKINSSGRLEKKISNPKGFLIDKMHLPNNALHSDNTSNWVSGVTLSEVLPSSLQPHLAMESAFLCDSPSAAISDIQSSPSMVSPESTGTQIAEMDAVSSQDKAAPCLFPSSQVEQFNSDLANMSFEASKIGDIERNSDAMPGFADDLLPVVGDSPDPDVDILLDDMPKLPGINDVFWEQFLAASPLPGDTDELNSSILGICGKEQDLQFEQEDEWDKIKNMNHLTEQMGLLAAASKQLA